MCENVSKFAGGKGKVNKGKGGGETAEEHSKKSSKQPGRIWGVESDRSRKVIYKKKKRTIGERMIQRGV